MTDPIHLMQADAIRRRRIEQQRRRGFIAFCVASVLVIAAIWIVTHA